MRYAIVDIETTGGSPQWHRITEIAIFIHDGNQVVDSWQSLINPQRTIPGNISMLTGITNEMVSDAPIFSDIAEKVLEFTQDAIFVAHSVNFDYGFIKQEFERIGINYNRKRLCTVRLSRKVFPGYKSYSLGTICQYKGISIINRHRAGGDAEATAQLLDLILKSENADITINEFLKRTSKEVSLPPNISKQLFNALPDTMGVYLFHDERGKIIYVGKSQKIKSRVAEHFSGNTHTKTRQMFRNSIFDVSYQETGSELIALLLENELIKKHYPRFNRSNKKFNLNTGVYQYEDQNGFQRLSIGKAGKRDQPLLTFQSNAEALNLILQKVKEFQLCMRLTGVIPNKSTCPAHEGNEVCFEVCHKKQSSTVYNTKFEQAFANERTNLSYILKTKGRHEEERGFVFVEHGRFLGYGFVSNDEMIYEANELKKYLNVCYDTTDSQTILKRFLLDKSIEKIALR